MAYIVDVLGTTIIDGTGRAPMKDGNLRIADGRITAVWQHPGMPSGTNMPADETVNAHGMTIMPGLIDAHCHISYGEGKAAEEVDVYGGAEWAAVRAVWNAQKVLQSGVTTICDPGSTWNVAVTCRDAILSGMFPGPRVLAGGRHISADGGFADYFPSWLGMPISAEGVLCHNRDQMIQEVRSQVKNRVDLVKISGDSQAQERLSAAGPCFMEDEMTAIVHMSHQLARKVTIHARYAETVAMAARAGVDWLIHASYMRADDIGLVRDRQIPICPTMTFTANVAQHGHEVGVDPNYIDHKRRELDALAEIHIKCIQAGVPFMMGSEAGFAITPYGQWHTRELELMVDILGMRPMDAIIAATANNAKAFGWEDQVGRLVPGLWADFLVIDGDPLQDIRILSDRSRIRAVYQGGVLIDRSPSAELPTRRRMAHERGFVVSAGTLDRTPAH